MASHRSHLWLASLLLTIGTTSLPVTAADTAVAWPLRWKAGDTWSYDTEYLDRETSDGATTATRTTNRTTVRIDEAGAGGYTQVWTTQGSTVEAIEGERMLVDLMAPMTERLDAMSVVVELDARGQYRRTRNLKTVAEELRSVMAELRTRAAAMAAQTAGDEGAKSNMPPASAATDEQAMLPLAVVEALVSAEIKTFNRYIGESYLLGERDYATLEMISDGGIVMIGDSDYSIAIDPHDATLARITWTHVLDQERDARTLWDYAQELSGEPIPRSARKGRPQALTLREHGFALFHRDTGAVVMMENEILSGYGNRHQRTQRMRMRASNFARDWETSR